MARVTVSTFWAQRVNDTLVPVDAESWAEFSKIPRNRQIYVEAKQPRNSAHLRLYWALVHRIANAVGCTPEALSSHLKVRTGHVTTVKTKDGLREYPASISFAALDQTQFSEFYNRCITVICEDLGLRRPDILEACKDLIDGGTEKR